MFMSSFYVTPRSPVLSVPVTRMITHVEPSSHFLLVYSHFQLRSLYGQGLLVVLSLEPLPLCLPIFSTSPCALQNVREKR